MDKFVWKISEYMRSQNMLPGKEHFVVGVSGGADSVALLYVLSELAQNGMCEIQAVHVHHGLRDSADEDQAYVQELCRKWGISCEVRRVDAGNYAKERGLGVEEAARELRYQIFEEFCSKWECESGIRSRIAVAHHLEDQAETVLFHMCRGSNLAGIGGMMPVNGRIVRPLLEVRREQIEAFLAERKIVWRTDETNLDVQYARNRLRLQVMPQLREVNHRAEEHFCSLAKEARELEEYLSLQTEEAIRRCSYCEGEAFEGSFSIDCLRKEAPVIRKRVLYRLLAAAAGHSKDLGAAHVELLWTFCEGNGYGSLNLPYGVTACRRYGRLIFERSGRSEFENVKEELLFPQDGGEYVCNVFERTLTGGAPPTKKYTKWLDYDKIASLPVFRKRQPGDRLAITDLGKTKKLSRYMIDEKIPVTCRDQMVLPVCGQDVLWVPGYRMNAAYKVTDSTRQILEISWVPGTLVEQKSQEYENQ